MFCILSHCVPSDADVFKCVNITDMFAAGATAVVQHLNSSDPIQAEESQKKE